MLIFVKTCKDKHRRFMTNVYRVLRSLVFSATVRYPSTMLLMTSTLAPSAALLHPLLPRTIQSRAARPGRLKVLTMINDKNYIFATCLEWPSVQPATAFSSVNLRTCRSSASLASIYDRSLLPTCDVIVYPSLVTISDLLPLTYYHLLACHSV